MCQGQSTAEVLYQGQLIREVMCQVQITIEVMYMRSDDYRGHVSRSNYCCRRHSSRSITTGEIYQLHLTVEVVINIKLPQRPCYIPIIRHYTVLQGKINCTDVHVDCPFNIQGLHKTIHLVPLLAT